VVVRVLSYRIHRTTTGAPLSIPVYAPGRFNVSMTQVGGGTHTMPLAMSRFTPTQWHASTLHWWHTLVIRWDGWPIYAGPIGKKYWNPRRKTLQLTTVTVDALLRDRFPFGVGSYHVGDFHVVSKSLRGAIAQIIRQVSLDGPTTSPWHSWALPFAISGLGEGGGFTRTWEAKEWATSADIVKDIRELDGGPDLAFVPAYDENENLRWDVRIGAPRVDGATIDVPLSVRNGPAGDWGLTEDGMAMLTGLFMRGEGGGEDRPFGEAGDFDAIPTPRPLMTVRDAARNAVAEKDTGILNGKALAQLRDDRFPTDQFDMPLIAGAGNWHPRDLTMGTRLNLRYSGDEYLDPFTSMQYVIALSHDASSQRVFTPEVQPL